MSCYLELLDILSTPFIELSSNSFCKSEPCVPYGAYPFLSQQTVEDFSNMIKEFYQLIRDNYWIHEVFIYLSICFGQWERHFLLVYFNNLEDTGSIFYLQATSNNSYFQFI